MISRFQPTRLITPLLIILCICAFSYWLNPDPWRHLTSTTNALFAASFLVFIILMITMRNRLYLRIDERGVEIKYAVGAPRFYPWADIESARIFRKRFLLIPVMSTIRLNLRPQARPTNAIRKAASAVTGYDATFPAFFDLSATEIIERITFYKSQHQPG
jgi:hypothetical protein